MLAEKDVAKWKMVSYFAMPREARHKLLDAAEKTFGAHRKKATDQRDAAQADKLERKEQAKAKADSRQLHAAVDCKKHLKLTRAASIGQLTQMIK